jgi:hypothetical protein
MCRFVSSGSIVLVGVVCLAAEVSTALAADGSPTKTSGNATQVVGATLDPTDCLFPPGGNLVDVTKPPYSAKGDGRTDDTASLQKALSDSMGQHKVIYLPNGTYLVSATLKWSKKNSQGKEAWGFNTVQGQNEAKTIIRLKDGTFTDPAKPQAIMWCGGFGSADWFHNYIENLTFDVGKDNPGAIGLQPYSNNTGAVRNVQIVSQDGKGAIGLDLGHRDMNGPLLVRNVIVKGFDVGVRCAHPVNSQTFERLSLTGQSKFGLTNDVQSVSIRGLYSVNEVPAVRAAGFTVLLDARLVRKDGADGTPAVQVAKGGFFARNVSTRGYKTAIECPNAPGAEGPHVEEFTSGKAANPFAGPTQSLGLPVEETPEVPCDDPKTWANVDDFGADPKAKDSSAAFQKAVDSGATTVYLPRAGYRIGNTVLIRGNVRRIIGCQATVDLPAMDKPAFKVVDGAAPVVIVERITSGFAKTTFMEHAAKRTLVMSDCSNVNCQSTGGGSLFLENVCSNPWQSWTFRGGAVWARQFNVENQGVHVLNDGGALWILGLKTERGGTLVHTRVGGKTEVFGNFSYTTTAGKLAPMFVTEDASIWAFFNEVCYNGDPYQVFIRETRSGQTKVIKRGEGGIAPYAGYAAGGKQ